MKKLFDEYAKEDQLDGRSFVKIFKDANLIKSKSHLTVTGLDIIFNKIKTKGKKKIDFDQFQDGIKDAAKENQSSVEELVEELQKLKGPDYHGTVP